MKSSYQRIIDLLGRSGCESKRSDRIGRVGRSKRPEPYWALHFFIGQAAEASGPAVLTGSGRSKRPEPYWALHLFIGQAAKASGPTVLTGSGRSKRPEPYCLIGQAAEGKRPDR